METENNIAHISILMPAYNAEKYIAETIDSMLAQSYPFFEFIIIDDASKDRTVEIIEKYEDKRIKLLRNEKNLGITATLNKGILASKYEFIARMDADDISHPWRLEKQIRYLLANQDCAMVASWVNLIDDYGNFLRVEGVKNSYLYYTLTFECCIYHPCIMFRKSAALQIGGYQMAYAEDFDLFWRFAQLFKIGGIDEPLVSYRYHANNTNLVSRKTEYARYLDLVVNRNINFYLGSKIDIPKTYIEALRYNLEPMLQSKSLKEIHDFFNFMNLIVREMIKTENPNRISSNIYVIHSYKRDYLLLEIAKNLNALDALSLLLSQNAPYLMKDILLFKIKNRIASK